MPVERNQDSLYKAKVMILKELWRKLNKEEENMQQEEEVLQRHSSKLLCGQMDSKLMKESSEHMKTQRVKCSCRSSTKAMFLKNFKINTKAPELMSASKIKERKITYHLHLQSMLLTLVKVSLLVACKESVLESTRTLVASL